MDSTIAVLSIKSCYSRQIFANSKRVEFRKASLRTGVTRVFVYETSPTQLIVGFFEVSAVVKDSPEGLWERFSDIGGISKDSFFEYFMGRESGYAYLISEPKSLERCVSLVDIGLRVAPQSIVYLDGSYLAELK